MKEKGFIGILIVILIIIVVAAAGFLYFGKFNIDRFNPFNNQAQQTTVTGEAQISITKDGFVPATLKVKKGTQVEWINTDILSHQLASDPHPTHNLLPGLNSEEVLNTSDSFSFTFENPGIYTYHGEDSPLKLKGTVIVE